MTVTVSGWDGPRRVPELLAEWLPAQRWFAGKGRPVHGLAVQTSTRLLPDDPQLHHLIVAVDHGEDVDRYQLLLGLRRELPQRLEHAALGRSNGWWAYDAAHDTAATRPLLELLAAGADVGDLQFRHPAAVTLDPDPPSLVLAGEQSNTSLVYGNRYILKLFRRVAAGRNPDLEVALALAPTGTPHVVPPLGWVEGRLAGDLSTFALLQPFLRNATDGWLLAETSVRDLYAEGDLHADEVGGDFASEATRLGVATAEVHRLMARLLPSRIADVVEAAGTAKQMQERLDAALVAVPELAEHASGLRAVYDELGQLSEPVPVQRIHGDLHLGQALRTETAWVLLDFEGEPARPLAERTALMSPLRDVAGMLRSFDYAARHLLADHPVSPHLAYRAAEWAERNRDAFCVGYANTAGADPRSHPVLLRAFELDKAVYEVVYEARHRPSWLPIPLGAIDRLVG